MIWAPQERTLRLSLVQKHTGAQSFYNLDNDRDSHANASTQENRGQRKLLNDEKQKE